MQAFNDGMVHKTRWEIRRYVDQEHYEAGVPTPVRDAVSGLWLPDVSVIEGNILLNVGIAVVWDLAAGTGSPTAFNSVNARIGVGDSNSAAVATHTGLQSVGNKTYQQMNTGYPQRANQTQQWQSVFGSAAALYAWNEFCVDNGNPAISLNRVVSGQGSKAGGQTWTVTVQILLS